MVHYHDYKKQTEIFKNNFRRKTVVEKVKNMRETLRYVKFKVISNGSKYLLVRFFRILESVELVVSNVL